MLLREVNLVVTYRRGKIVAGYLHLPDREGDHAARSREADSGLVVDFAEDGRPIGIEITLPSVVTVEAVNKVLAELKLAPVADEELWPFFAEKPALRK